MAPTGSSSTEASASSLPSTSASPALASNNHRNNNTNNNDAPPPPGLGAVPAPASLSMATMAGALTTVAASSTTTKTTTHPLPPSFIPSTPVPSTPQLFQQLKATVSQLEENAATAADTDKILRTHREQMAATSLCVICLGERPNIATLCCGQPVHHNCAATWLLNSPTCMYCRAAFPPSQEGERLQQQQEEQLRVKIKGLVLTNDRLRRPVYFEASMRDGYPGTLPDQDGTLDDVTGDDTAVWNVRFDQFADTNTDFLPYPDGTGDDFQLRLSGNYVFDFDETTCVYKYGRNNRTPRGETPQWRDVGFGISGSRDLSVIVFFRIGPISYREFMALFPKRQSIGISELMRRLKAKRHNYEMKLDSVAFPLFRIISILSLLQSMGISTEE